MGNIKVSNGAALEAFRSQFNRPEVQAAMGKVQAALNNPRVAEALSRVKSNNGVRTRTRTGWNPRGYKRVHAS